jgi:hypothetical protein
MTEKHFLYTPQMTFLKTPDATAETEQQPLNIVARRKRKHLPKDYWLARADSPGDISPTFYLHCIAITLLQQFFSFAQRRRKDNNWEEISTPCNRAW